MIIVHSIKTSNAPGWSARIVLGKPEDEIFNPLKTLINDYEHSETVYGQEYLLPNKEKIIIGWSKQTYEALKIPLSCLNDQEKMLNAYSTKLFQLEKKYNQLNFKYNTFKNLSFWKKYF